MNKIYDQVKSVTNTNNSVITIQKNKALVHENTHQLMCFNLKVENNPNWKWQFRQPYSSNNTHFHRRINWSALKNMSFVFMPLLLLEMLSSNCIFQTCQTLKLEGTSWNYFLWQATLCNISLCGNVQKVCKSHTDENHNEMANPCDSECEK